MDIVLDLQNALKSVKEYNSINNDNLIELENYLNVAWEELEDSTFTITVKEDWELDYDDEMELDYVEPHQGKTFTGFHLVMDIDDFSYRLYRGIVDGKRKEFFPDHLKNVTKE